MAELYWLIIVCYLADFLKTMAVNKAIFFIIIVEKIFFLLLRSKTKLAFETLSEEKNPFKIIFIETFYICEEKYIIHGSWFMYIALWL